MNLSKFIDDKRIIHSQGVSEKAMELASVYNLDVEVCKVAGLLHDIGKSVKYTTGDPVIFHCYEGVRIAKEEFNITDERILNAILYHTTAHSDMDDYAKVIYIADKTEKNRDYGDVEYLRKLTGLPLNMIVAEVIESSKKYHEELHPWTKQLIEEWGINE